MKSVFKFCLRLARCSSGSALVEMTVIFPLVVALMVGAVDLSMALATQATGAKSVHDAARYLATLPPSAASLTWAQQNAQNLAVYGNTDKTGLTPLISGWSTSDVQISTAAGPTVCGTTGVPCCLIQITVTATFPYTSIFLTNLVPIASNYTMSAQHEECSIG